MRLTVQQVGYVEDPDGDESLVVGLAGTDEGGVWRSFEVQRSTYEPDEQDVRGGMDSYCVSTERGLTVYGCLTGVRLTEMTLTLEFAAEDARILEISTPVDADLGESGANLPELSTKLRAILDWGNDDKRPQLTGFIS